VDTLAPLFSALDRNASAADHHWYVIRKALLTADSAVSLASSTEVDTAEVVRHTASELAGKLGLSVSYDHLPDEPSIEDAQQAIAELCTTIRRHMGTDLLAYRAISSSTEELKSAIGHVIRQKAMEADNLLSDVSTDNVTFQYYPLLVSRKYGFAPVYAIQATYVALKAFSQLSKALTHAKTKEDWLALIHSALPEINAGLPIYYITLTQDELNVGMLDPQFTNSGSQPVSVNLIKPLISEITDYLNENHDMVAMPSHNQLNEAAFTGTMDLVNAIRLEIPKLLHLALFSQLTYVISAAAAASQQEKA
jgi:hypothetical protein